MRAQSENYNIMKQASERNINSQPYITIKKEYLTQINYQSVKENNQRLNQSYDQLCNIFISNYEAFAKSSIKLIDSQSFAQKKADDDATKFKSIAFFTRFLIDFQNIMNQVANFQIANLTRLQTESKINSNAYLDLMNQLKDLNGVYEGIEKSRLRIDLLFKEIKLQFVTYKKNAESPMKFYDQNYVSKTNEKLLGFIKKAIDYISQITEKNQYIQKRIPQFQAVLSKWKCKLVKNKYTILKKIKHFIQNNKSAFIELSFLIKECIANHQSLYLKAVQDKLGSAELRQLMRKTPAELGHPSDQNKRWQLAIKTTLNNNWNEYEAIYNIFNNVKSNLNALYKEYQIKRQKLRETIDKLSQFYDQIQSPFEELVQIFKMNDSLHERLDLIANKLKDMMKGVGLSKRNCVKQGEILQSLLKIKTRKNQHFLEFSDTYKKNDIMELVKDVANCSPKQHIVQFYEYWTATQEWITQSIKSTLRPRSKTADSMEVSHTIGQDKFAVQRKRPLKEEVWLWKDFRQEMNINLQLYQEYFSEIQKYAENMAQKFTNKNNLQLEKCECFLLKLKQQATLTLFSQNITIISSEANLSIRWKEITNIEQVSQFFDNVLVITTAQGKIELSKFQTNLGTLMASIKEIQEKSLMGNQTKKIQSKKEIPLSEEQIKQIMQRKEKIIKDVPTIEGYTLIVQHTLQNQRIDEVYELIYSDKPFNFYGREEACFFTYCGKKSGNINWVAQKYDQPGPEFYSLEPGVNFKNCPLFSTRRIRYNHPMKPTSIPFMPKQSRNEDERRIYWVSHEQFVYLIKSLTFDVPMTENFEVYIQHRINKVDKNTVKIGIYMKVHFVKETSFKNIILKNTEPEIAENMTSFMEEIKKLFRLRKEVANGAKMEVEQEPPTQEKVAESSSDSQVGKLKLYNKILIAGLLLILLLNVLGIL